MSKSFLLALLLCVLGGGLDQATATDFSNVGLGITETGAVINAIAAGPSAGQLYVGGHFTLVNGTGADSITANNIAMWDGTEWHALGSGINGTVTSICVIGRLVYVGGTFTQTASNPAVAVNNVAIWNSLPSQWFALGSGGPVGGGVNGPVTSLNAASVSGTTQLIVGGTFTIVNGSSNGFSPAGSNGNLAIYNPAGTPSATFLPFQTGTNNSVLCGSVRNNTVANGGTFTTAGPNAQVGVATSLGGNFVATTNFGSTPVDAISYDTAGDLYVGGTFAPAIGNGNSTSISCLLSGAGSYTGLAGGVTITTPTAGIGTVNAILFDVLNTSEPIIGGRFDIAGGVPAENLVQWNPSAGTFVTYIGGTDGTVNALGEDSFHSIYVGGSFDSATSTAGSILSALVRVGPNQDTGGSASSTATATATGTTTTATGASASASATGTATTGTATAATTGNVAVPASGGSSGCGLGSSMGVMLILAMLLAWKRLR